MKKFIIAIALCLCLVACAAFNYKYYGINPQAGTLLGATPDKDLPLSTCQGDAAQQGKCVVFLVDEFDRLQADYVRMVQRLKACEGQ